MNELTSTTCTDDGLKPSLCYPLDTNENIARSQTKPINSTKSADALPSLEGHVIWRLRTASGTLFLHLSVSLQSLTATNTMADFASLPNELICEIFKLVQPADLESFAQISRNVFSLASPFLNEHRVLIREYHTLRNNTDPRSITNFLSTVIANPRIGSYVKKVELGPLSNSQIVYTNEELEMLTTAALGSECLKRPSEEEILDERDFWYKKIQHGNDDILLAILLPLLPNLVVLSARVTAGRLKWYNAAIEQAAFATKPTLCKLTEIRLNACGVQGSSLVEIQKFSALPSVRVLTAPNAYGIDCLHKISPNTNSNVTHLKLWDSWVDTKALYEFLRGFAKLQSFTYSYCFASGAPHDAFLIRASLLAHCKATLQSLTLLDPSNRHTSFMGSLRGFETLREVYTEWSFLVAAGYGQKIQLNEHLPASLVRLKIHDSTGREKYDYEKVIKSAQYAKEHGLQKLKWLIFGGFQVAWSLEDVDRGLRKTCRNMGISLIFSPYAPKSGE